MDPYVIDLPWPARALLVHGIILNTRPKKSAEAYQSIWTEQGSPLIYHCNALTESLQTRFEEPVELAMAYGNPSLPAALDSLLDQGVEEICLLPSFRSMRWPQLARVSAGYKNS